MYVNTALPWVLEMDTISVLPSDARPLRDFFCTCLSQSSVAKQNLVKYSSLHKIVYFYIGKKKKLY